MLALAVGRQRGERSASFAAHFLVPNPTANPVGDRGRFAFRRSPAVVNSTAGFFVETRSHSSCIAPSLRPTQSRESRRYTRRDGHRTGFLARPVLPPGPTRGFEAPGSVFKEPEWSGVRKTVGATRGCAAGWGLMLASFALPTGRSAPWRASRSTSRIHSLQARAADLLPDDPEDRLDQLFAPAKGVAACAVCGGVAKRRVGSFPAMVVQRPKAAQSSPPLALEAASGPLGAGVVGEAAVVEGVRSASGPRRAAQRPGWRPRSSRRRPGSVPLRGRPDWSSWAWSVGSWARPRR